MAGPTNYRAPADVRYQVSGDNSILKLVLYRLWNKRCYWCMTSVVFRDAQIDHAIPRSGDEAVRSDRRAVGSAGAALPVARRPVRPPNWTKRQLINGIRWRVRAGTLWRDIPACYGSWAAAYALFRRWQRDGTWARILTRCGGRGRGGPDRVGRVARLDGGPGASACRRCP